MSSSRSRLAALPPCRLAVVLLAIGPLPAFGQQSAGSEREALYQRYVSFASLVKGGTVRAGWVADKNSFWFAEGGPVNTVIWKIDPRTNAKTPLFDVARVRQALAPALGHEPLGSGLPFEDFTFLDGEKAVRFTVESRDFIMRLDSYAVTPAPPLAAERPRTVRSRWPITGSDVVEVPSPDRRWFAFDRGGNVVLRSPDNGALVQLTADGAERYGWDASAAKWSPDSYRLAVSKTDDRKVHLIPIVRWMQPEEQVEWMPYDYTGGNVTQTEVYVIDVLSRKQTRIDTGSEPDQWLYVAGWKPDGSELYVLRLDRLMKHIDLLAANPQTGATRVILTDRQDSFIEGLRLFTVLDNFVTPLADRKRFVWLSERDGWTHLYLYDMNGTLIRRLTSGAFPVTRVVGVDEERGWIYFTAHGDQARPYDTHLYRVDMEGKRFARLTEATGEHEIRLSPSKEFFLDTHSTVDRPPAVELRRADGSLVQVVSKANVDALAALKWRDPEPFVVKAADDKTDLHGVLFKPYDFDPAKRYPVIDIIYPGSQTTAVPRTFLGNAYGNIARAFAQLGFITFVVDGRGTPERGKAFQDVVYQNIGRNEIPDHVAALKQLGAARSYMDLSRVGITGHSWGGYFTLRAMLMFPDVYQVGVVSSPVVELMSVSPTPIEPYMGLPQENREAYQYASNIRLAGSLTGKVLMIIGTSDINTPFAQTMRMVDAFVRVNKQFDMLVLPEQNHVWSGVGNNMRAYWQDRVRRYFQEHLKPESGGAGLSP